MTRGAMGNEERRQRNRRAPGRTGGRRAEDPPAEWITASAFARKYGIDRATVRKWLKSNILLTYRVGRLVRIRDVKPDDHRVLLKVRTDAETGP